MSKQDIEVLKEPNRNSETENYNELNWKMQQKVLVSNLMK